MYLCRRDGVFPFILTGNLLYLADNLTQQKSKSVALSWPSSIYLDKQ